MLRLVGEGVGSRGGVEVGWVVVCGGGSGLLGGGDVLGFCFV